MTNKGQIQQMLTDQYTALAGAHKYIFGFTMKGVVYMAIVDESVLPYVIKLDVASRGKGYCLRFRPTTAQKMTLMTYATPLCSEAFFNSVYASSKYNKGEIFEKLVTEYFGQVWHKDSVPFTQCGDINVDGVEYQIKYQNASFIDETTLHNIESHMA